MNGPRRAFVASFYGGCKLLNKRYCDIPRSPGVLHEESGVHEARIKHRFQHLVGASLGEAVLLERAGESPFKLHHGPKLLLLRKYATHLRRGKEKRVQDIAHRGCFSSTTRRTQSRSGPADVRPSGRNARVERRGSLDALVQFPAAPYRSYCRARPQSTRG